jgi:ATP/maltotriose-dependent transcriptional regulator MalT
MKAKPQMFLVVEDHPEVAQNNCDFLIKFDPSAVCLLEVLKLLCHDSLTDQAIAHRLHISLRAVQNHIQHLKVKLGIDEVEQKDINSRVALCMTAIEKKLLLF